MSFIKKYLRLFLINFLALWLVGKVLAGINFIDGYQTIALAALALTLADFLIKPLIKLLLFPINLLTLGSFRWLVDVIVLKIITMIIPQFQIIGFQFTGFIYNGFIIPSMFIIIFWAYVLTSLIVSLITTLILWLIK